MKILSNTNVIDFRNKTFKKIVDNKDLIIKDLDSIYYMYSSVHKRYNDNFLWLKLHQYKYFKKIPSFEIVPQTNNSNSIINETISSSNTSHDFNLIMDETLTPALNTELKITQCIIN